MIKRFGCLIVGASLLGISLVTGCGSSSLAQCRIDAVRDAALALPEDETQVSIGDVVGLVGRLSQCRAVAAPPSSGGTGGSSP